MPPLRSSTSLFRLSLVCGVLLAACTVTLPSKDSAPATTENDDGEISENAVTAEHDSERKELPPDDVLQAISGSLLANGFLSLGTPDAPHVLLVFTNHSCRYCREFERQHLPRLAMEMIRSGKLRVEIIIRPLQKYPESALGAAALLCAGDAPSIAEFHDTLTELSPLSVTTVSTAAKEAGMNVTAMRSCMEGDEAARLLAEHAALSQSLKVDLVPTFFLDGERIIGLPEYADLRAKILRLDEE